MKHLLIVATASLLLLSCGNGDRSAIRDDTDNIIFFHVESLIDFALPEFNPTTDEQSILVDTLNHILGKESRINLPENLMRAICPCNPSDIANCPCPPFSIDKFKNAKLYLCYNENLLIDVLDNSMAFTEENTPYSMIINGSNLVMRPFQFPQGSSDIKIKINNSVVVHLAPFNHRYLIESINYTDGM